MPVREHDTLEEARGKPPKGRAPAKRKPKRQDGKPKPEKLRARRANARARRADAAVAVAEQNGPPRPRFGPATSIEGEDGFVGDPERPWCSPENDAIWEKS